MAKKNSPLFSIITPVLNDKLGLIQTMESLKIQKLRDFEHIVIDGGSTDGTLQFIKDSKLIDIWISEKDEGIYDGINKGIKISNGTYINTINAGDFYRSEDSLSTINEYFNKNDVDFIFGAVEKKKIYHNYKPEKMYWTFNFYPAHSGGFFVKRKVHEKIGLYSLKFPCSSDYDFFWRLIKNNKSKGISTKKNEVISVFKSGGFSARYGVFKHIWEETLIRYHNKQNKFFVTLLLVLRLIRNCYKIF
tara:strand:+ start:8217 stop:8957 length:741 start_codon:yes stop_codon:yes gene_type:complete